MKKYCALSLIVLLLTGLSLIFGLRTPQVKALITATPSSTPECTTHTTEVTLQTEPSAPIVGGTLTSSITLSNTGCSSIGRPEYTLSVAQNNSVLSPETPDSIARSILIPSGSYDKVQIPLSVVGVGQVSLRASVRFEAQIGYDPPYLANSYSDLITITIPTTGSTLLITPTEVLILQQAGKNFPCEEDVSITGTKYTLVCNPATGHSGWATIEQFETHAEAQSAFEEEQQGTLVEPFHCYTAYHWSVEEPFYEEAFGWVVGQWLITTRSFDDTHFQIAPEPIPFAEAIYGAGTGQGLPWGCYNLYLPLILKGVSAGALIQ